MSQHIAASRRWILHVDMDAFYASVEQRDNPELRGLPVIVGGTGPRGVVSAASYEARKFGVFSAMPASRARQLCPHGQFIRPRMSVYQQASKQVFQVFRQFTPVIEPLSLDEAFLDVTGSVKLHGSPVSIAKKIKQRVFDQTQLIASVGVAYNKYLAKLASDADKPDGLKLVTPDTTRQFLDPLPVQRMWGIGKQTLKKLHQSNIHTVEDLRCAPRDLLTALLGRQWSHFLALARGEDHREVVAGRADKSISAEVTFDEDLTSLAQCRKSLLGLSGRVGLRLRDKQLAGRTLTLKIRTTNFRTFTRSTTFSTAISEDKSIYHEADQLFQLWWEEHEHPPVRLLGVGVGHLQPGQADLFTKQHSELDQVSDRIKDRFGTASIKPASLIKPSESNDSD